MTPADAEADASTPINIALPVRIDGADAGTLMVGLLAERIVHVEEGSWRNFASGRLSASNVDQIAAAAADGVIQAAVFAEAGMKLDFDPTSLTITFVPNDEQRAIRSISLRDGLVDYADLSPFQRPAPSAYMNVNVEQQLDHGRDSGSQTRPLQAALDGAVRPFGQRGPV